jgi:threonylcarbamoyladenosine tRNA methylthiotransferase MtaB
MATRVAMVTLGCKVNAYDTAALAERLRSAGCRIVGAADAADVVVVNSCSVTNAADAESRRLVHRAGRRTPAPRIVVTGCWAQTNPAAAAGLPGVAAVVGTGQPDAVVRAVLADSRDDGPRIAVADVRRLRDVDTTGARGFGGQTRAFLKVQEGCDLFCTFCIVPMARGRSRSLAPRAVLTELEALAARGYQEVVLTGVHLGGYGHDLNPQRDLAWLLEALAEQSLVPRLRLSSIDPHEVTETLVRRVAEIPALCEHFHVPLQAGDDGVLARMRRRNDVALARERLAMIRDLIPDAAIGTDLIAGFPGESATAFEGTVRLLRSSPVTYAHVFPYSPRSGTTAAKLPGHLPAPLVRARAQRLRRIAAGKRQAFARRWDGTEAEVLVEGRRDATTGRLRGYTRNYLRVQVDGPDTLAGRRVRVRLAVRGSEPLGTVLG